MVVLFSLILLIYHGSRVLYHTCKIRIEASWIVFRGSSGYNRALYKTDWEFHRERYILDVFESRNQEEATATIMGYSGMIYNFEHKNLKE
ncbi:hypothetical protein C5167_008974 [Papaver somniferum]|uniref:Uncharacterized protein n=1 Tax=Papaver somniferum TaxID=3469 RepID=A0A4Y7K001_PAPSO|nr:hypothetical protein C5167_008974 [Papaver somniferum]